MRGMFMAAGLLALLAAPATADDVARLCDGRPGCELRQEVKAGYSSGGAALRVLEIAFAEPPADSWAEGLSCHEGFREFWVLEERAQSYLLLELCNDGYGASGVGEDWIEISDNRLMHWQSGGSAWRWAGKNHYQLSPAAVLAQEWEGHWTIAYNYESGHWDWRDFSAGAVEWWSPFCLADGYPPDIDTENPPDEPIGRYLLIPQLAEEALPRGGLEASLGSCALTVSTETDRGFLVHGEAAEAEADAAWMKVLAVGERTLLVTVRTQQLATGGKSWLSDDHLEIWQGPRASYGDHCLDAKAATRQWAVRLSDGAVFGAHGNPKTLPRVLARNARVDSSNGGVIVTLALELAEPPEQLTVIFSKGDGKKRQKWLLATSQLAFGKAWTLGGLFPIEAESKACTLVDGRLEITGKGKPLP